MNLKARILAAALAFVALASPRGADAAGHHRARSHHSAPSYPMKADEFRTLMEKRIDGVRATIDRKLDRHGVTPDRKKAIHKIFDEATRDTRAEIDRAAADGTVTQSEADKVKKLTLGLRARVRERLRADKNPHAPPHAKDKLAREDAAKKEKALKAAALKKAGAAKDDGGDPPQSKPTPKPADDSATTRSAKAKPEKKGAPHPPGPTKTAKAKPGKKRKHAKAEPGANL